MSTAVRRQPPAFSRSAGWSVALLTALVISIALPVLFGCAATRAVDTTAALDRLTAAERQATYAPFPGNMTGDPDLAGKTILIPTMPGKNVTLKTYYENGQERLSLTTERSAVLDALWAGANAADAAKFAQDQWQAQFWAEFARDMVNTALSLRAQVATEKAGAATQPSGEFQAELKTALLEWLKQQARPDGTK